MISESDKDHGVSIRAAADHLRKTINAAEKDGLNVDIDVRYVYPVAHGGLTIIETKIERRESV